MKVGILTFHWAANYGAILQCLALQNYLMDLGHDVEIIHYKPREYDWRITYLFKHPRQLLALRPFFNTRRKDAILEVFRQSNLALTRRFYSECELSEFAQKYDVVISGSDQVLNESYTLYGEGRPTQVYFLGTIPSSVRKIGYALSFGCKEYSEEAYAFASQWIQNFDAVSVREKSGLNIIRGLKYQGVSTLVPDPVLLYGEKLISKYKGIVPYRDRRVCVYLLRRSIDLAGKDILFIDDYHAPLSMEKWLYEIVNSRMLVTNSYHGMLVAILAHVPFVVDIEKTRGVGMNDRFYTILDKLNLCHRISSENSDIAALMNDVDIDWEDVDSRLAAYKNVGNDYLTANIGVLYEDIAR